MSQAILKEVSEKVTQFTGWENIAVSLDQSVLKIDSNGYAVLHYNLRNGQVLFGHVRQVGFSSIDLEDLGLRLLK